MDTDDTGARPGPAPATPVAVPLSAIPPVTERVPVDFTGEGAGVDELSWGMWEIWHAMSGQNSSLPIGGRVPLPEGTTVADVAEELRYLMTRFPSMRTRLRFDAEGWPTQQLFGSGRTALEVYDAGDADPDQLALAIELRWRETDFDYVDEWPVRMAVVRQDGLPSHLVTIMDHLVTDALGAMMMLREVKDRVTTPVTGMQQLEQARWQNSPAGQRQNDKALRHWEGILRTIPAGRFAGSADPRSPRHWSADFRSPALTAALPVIAARTGTDTPTVLLSLYAVALNRITGVNPVVVRPVVNNRFRPALADVVCMVAQAGICVLDVADATVDQVVERARRGTMSAYKYAYFHPEHVRRLIAQVSRERGEEVDVACFFNDRSTHRKSPDDLALSGDELDEALRKAQGDTVFRWTAQREDPIERLFVSVDDAPDGLLIEIHFDTHFFSPADTEALARGMEAIAVEAALDPALPKEPSR
ncbi:condensation domain-containing protein [Streptacidiphilus sp. N1-3]|uniref:Condensation domain-containing protein n=1 Tax=Streptacidiphilus alkalitolerans TaxID=3342712 RepID=A0ABV6X648_9ACTN